MGVAKVLDFLCEHDLSICMREKLIPCIMFLSVRLNNGLFPPKKGLVMKGQCLVWFDVPNLLKWAH